MKINKHIKIILTPEEVDQAIIQYITANAKGVETRGVSFDIAVTKAGATAILNDEATSRSLAAEEKVDGTAKEETAPFVPDTAEKEEVKKETESTQKKALDPKQSLFSRRG